MYRTACSKPHLGRRIGEHANARGSGPQLTQEPKQLRRKVHRDEADTKMVTLPPAG
jgi:hypothetical protein